MPWLLAALGSVGSAIGSAAGGIGSALGGIGSGALSGLEAAGSALGSAGSAAMSGLESSGGGIADAMQSALGQSGTGSFGVDPSLASVTPNFTPVEAMTPSMGAQGQAFYAPSTGMTGFGEGFAHGATGGMYGRNDPASMGSQIGSVAGQQLANRVWGRNPGAQGLSQTILSQVQGRSQQAGQEAQSVAAQQYPAKHTASLQGLFKH